MRATLQVKVVDVFAMPQSGTGVSVEAVDPVFQTKMLDMLKQTGRRDSRSSILILRLIPRTMPAPGGARMSRISFVSYFSLTVPNRPEMVVGWYHSHPGFGCWLSGVDINTQQARRRIKGSFPLTGASTSRFQHSHMPPSVRCALRPRAQACPFAELRAAQRARGGGRSGPGAERER